MHTKHAHYDTPGSPWYQLDYMHVDPIVHTIVKILIWAYKHTQYISI